MVGLSVRADEQLGGDRPICSAHRDELEHFYFASGQIVRQFRRAGRAVHSVKNRLHRPIDRDVGRVAGDALRRGEKMCWWTSECSGSRGDADRACVERIGDYGKVAEQLRQLATGSSLGARRVVVCRQPRASVGAAIGEVTARRNEPSHNPRATDIESTSERIAVTVEASTGPLCVVCVECAVWASAARTSASTAATAFSIRRAMASSTR